MSIGIWQILAIVAVVILLFGRGRIAPFMEDLGKGISSFKKGLKDTDEHKDIRSLDDKNRKE